LIVAINIGANTGPNCGKFRAPIFYDGRFHYIPIPELADYVIKPPIYANFSFKSYVPNSLWKTPMHADPEFETMTYGHALRGYGCEPRLKKLKEKKDFLLFYASLRYVDEKNKHRASWINPAWGSYIVGFFKVEHVINQIKGSMIQTNMRVRFKNNAHLKRKSGHADFWISGNPGHLLKKALALSDSKISMKPNDFTRRVFKTPTGKPITSNNTGFYRQTLVCNDGEAQKEIFTTIGKLNHHIKNT
jgi:hypothetical protein